MTTKKMHDPPHPGLVLRKLCLEPLGLTISETADVPGVSRKGAFGEPERVRRHQPGDGRAAVDRVRDVGGELAQSADSVLWHAERKRKTLRVKPLAA